MPSYDFKCPKCGKIKEENVSVADRNKVRIKCVKCGKIRKRVETYSVPFKMCSDISGY